MYVTKLELWNDTGFVENSAEYPNLSDTLTNPDYTYTDLHPAKEDLFSYFKIKGVSYETLISVSYARVTYDNLSYPVYMWVDSVACISDTSTKLTAVSCHVDLWRTYLGDASLGYGLITKRIRGTADPIQSCPYRYRLADGFTSMGYTGLGNNLAWVIVNTTVEIPISGSEGTDTQFRAMIFPVDPKYPDRKIKMTAAGQSDVYAPKLSDFITSNFDERLGIDPTALTSAFISPFPPLPIESFKDDTITFQTSIASQETTYTSEYYNCSSIYTKGWEGVWESKFQLRQSDGTVNALRWQVESTMIDDLKSYLHGYSVKLSNASGSSDLNISQTLNGAGVSFFNPVSIDNFVSDAMGGLGRIAKGDTVTVNADTYGSFSLVVSKGSSIHDWNCAWTAGVSTVKTYTFDGTTFGTGYVNATPNSSFEIKLGAQATKYSVYTVSCKDGYGYAYNADGKYLEFAQEFDTPIRTTDTSECIITDYDARAIGSLPWGFEIKDYTARLVISGTSAYVEYRLNGIDSHVTGLCYDIPLPSVDITSNSWSSYVYSGQREYDIEQRKIASQQALVSGITGGLQSSVSTGVMGTIGEMKGKDKEAPIASATGVLKGQPVYEAAEPWSLAKKAGVTGGVMAAASIGGALVDYAAAQYFNGKLQDAEDTLQAKQTDTLVTSGTGWDWLWNGRDAGVVTLVPDDYSLVNFQNNIQYNGITCSEPTADCSAYKDYLGPIQIQNLIVTGDIPVQAKYLIANTYAKGIRMKCVNEKPDYDITADTLITDHQIKAGTYVFYNNTEYQYKINCVGSVELREQYIVDAGQKTSITLVTGDTISTLYYNKLWVINSNTVTVL